MGFDVLFQDKPWGAFAQYAHNQEVTVKIITVNPGERLSLQRHKHREEMWVPLDEGLVSIVDGKCRRLWKDKDFLTPVRILRGVVHTMENVETAPARFLEVSFGHFDEDDIERLDDKYGRC